MSNTNQHDRHVEILAEVKQKPIELDHVVTCRQALSAMQRAVEEARNVTDSSALNRHRKTWNGKSDEWLFERLDNELKDKVETIGRLNNELTTLRTELERVRGAVDIVKNLSEWSLKYPRSRIYPMQRQDKMDGELISIEKAAKDFTQQTKGGSNG